MITRRSFVGAGLVAVGAMAALSPSLAFAGSDDSSDGCTQAEDGQLYEENAYERACSLMGCSSSRWGDCGPFSFDCSGFVSYCLTGKATRVGTSSSFASWPKADNPKPGDICTNRTHCGIYAGDGLMIHCSSIHGDVVQESLYENMIIVRRP